MEGRKDSVFFHRAQRQRSGPFVNCAARTNKRGVSLDV